METKKSCRGEEVKNGDLAIEERTMERGRFRISAVGPTTKGRFRVERLTGGADEPRRDTISESEYHNSEPPWLSELVSQNKAITAQLADVAEKLQAPRGEQVTRTTDRPGSAGSAERPAFGKAFQILDTLKRELESARDKRNEHENVMKVLKQKNVSLTLKLEQEQAALAAARKDNERLREKNDELRRRLGDDDAKDGASTKEPPRRPPPLSRGPSEADVKRHADLNTKNHKQEQAEFAAIASRAMQAQQQPLLRQNSGGEGTTSSRQTAPAQQANGDSAQQYATNFASFRETTAARQLQSPDARMLAGSSAAPEPPYGGAQSQQSSMYPQQQQGKSPSQQQQPHHQPATQQLGPQSQQSQPLRQPPPQLQQQQQPQQPRQMQPPNGQMPAGAAGQQAMSIGGQMGQQQPPQPAQPGMQQLPQQMQQPILLSTFTQQPPTTQQHMPIPPPQQQQQLPPQQAQHLQPQQHQHLQQQQHQLPPQQHKLQQQQHQLPQQQQSRIRPDQVTMVGMPPLNTGVSPLPSGASSQSHNAQEEAEFDAIASRQANPVQRHQ